MPNPSTPATALRVGGVLVTVTRKPRLKNAYIRVKPPAGDVVVSAPPRLSGERLRLVVLNKLPKILAARERLKSQRRQRPRRYVSGEAHYLWGRPYKLRVREHEKRRYVIKKTPGAILMTVPATATAERKAHAMREWQRAELRRVLPGVVTRCERRAGIRAADPVEVRVRDMRTRWGVCNAGKRRITVNLQLVKKPVECLEYVVIHELVHLLHRRHTALFNETVEKFCPCWRQAKRLLDEMPLQS